MKLVHVYITSLTNFKQLPVPLLGHSCCVIAYSCISMQRITCNVFIAMYRLRKCVIIYRETVWILILSRVIKKGSIIMHLYCTGVPLDNISVLLLKKIINTHINIYKYIQIYDNCDNSSNFWSYGKDIYSFTQG